MQKKKKFNKENLYPELNLKTKKRLIRHRTQNQCEEKGQFYGKLRCSQADQHSKQKPPSFYQIEEIENSLQLKTKKKGSISNIEALKRHAQMLDEQVKLGSNMMTEQSDEHDQYDQMILKTLDMNEINEVPKQIIPKLKSSESTICPETKKSKQSQNYRKIVKGRPQLYNWVRKYKQELAVSQNLAQLKADYQTENLKKNKETIVRDKKLEKKDEVDDKKRRYSASSLIHNYANKIRLQNCHTSKHKSSSNKIRGTFLQRLKTLEDNRCKNEQQEWKKYLNDYAKSALKQFVQQNLQLDMNEKLRTKTEFP